MTDEQWKIFCDFKERFQKKVEEWKASAPELTELQRQAAKAAKTPDYPFETTVVYNRDFDKLTKDDDIKLIVIGDNPGKDEQLAKNNRYLVGQAGKIADGFFKRNPELGVDFRKNVIIVNKTPVHSAKTTQLRKIMKDGGEKIQQLILESQLWMAEETAKLHHALCMAAGNDYAANSSETPAASSRGDCSSIQSPDSCNITCPELWLVGYSELKNKGFFVPYKNKLKEEYSRLNGTNSWDKVFVFQHFSMNCFTKDLKNFAAENPQSETLLNQLHQIGMNHKKEIFG